MSSRELVCACGHLQREHRAGVGACRCGCERPHRKRADGLAVLGLVEPGIPGKVAPTYAVCCPECGRTYETRAFLREIIRRERCRACADGMRLVKKSTRRTPRAERPSDLPPPAAFSDRPHGTRVRYVSGCRCAQCREANRAYARMRGKLVRAGEGDPLVSAARARAHMLRLSKQGIGRRSVADRSGVPSSSLAAIRSGEKQKIRRSTQARILAVNAAVKNDDTRVDAAPTRKRIVKLLEVGFTRGAIALRLGMRTPSLQIAKRATVTAKTEARVARLCREIFS